MPKQAFTSNEMTEDMKGMFIQEDCFNWSSATIAIGETIGALHGYMKRAAEQELGEWSFEERNTLDTLIKHNYEHDERDNGQNLYSLKCSDRLCIKIFKRLRDMSSMQKKPLRLSIKPLTIFERLFLPQLLHPDWWKLLTFFLPRDEKNEPRLETCTLKSLRYLIENCCLFGHLKNLKIFDEIIRIRNKLTHSATYEITSQEKMDFIGTMKQFVEYLESERVKRGWAEIFQIQNAQTCLEKSGQINFNDEDPCQKYRELQKALEKKSDEIRKDMETIDHELSEMLKKLKAGADENLKMFDQINWKDDTLKSLAEGIVLGAKEGAMAVGGGQNIRLMGYFTGAAGAAGAGLYEKVERTIANL